MGGWVTFIIPSISHFSFPFPFLCKKYMEFVPDWVLGTAPPPVMMAHIMPLSRFEAAVVVSRRALQLSRGAPSTVFTASDRVSATDPVAVAMKEFECNRLPAMRVFRYLPDGTHVVVRVSDANMGLGLQTRAW
jgi:DNA-directed RNA polymerase subunit K/omega